MKTEEHIIWFIIIFRQCGHDYKLDDRDSKFLPQIYFWYSKYIQRTWLSVAKIHLYLSETPRDKRGVLSHVIFDAELISGVKIAILSIFDPQKPFFGSKKDPNQIIFLSSPWLCIWPLFYRLIHCILLKNYHLRKIYTLGPQKWPD